ncbi:MAG TPA: DUF4013 domain-containing protein [Thermoanaerobaculia bacterium]|nr:DUF4013 domain-containing protein [Thermoanaerobaculia bacterium]
MSEIGNVPPPPVPPPSQPPPPQPPVFDFVRPFAFVFEDPRWLSKVAIGGLFYLAAFFIIGTFFILGYCARLARNVIAGDPRPLPEWDDLGTYFSEGAMLFAVGLVYMLPIIAIFGFFFVPAIVMAAAAGENELMQTLSGGFMSLIWCLTVPLSLALSLWMPGALLFAVVDRRFSAAFEFSRIWNFIKANFANYLLAFVVYLIARMAGGVGFILCCIGVIFTAFWAMVITTYSYATVYRLSRVK